VSDNDQWILAIFGILVLEILNHWNNVLTVENLPYLSGKAERNIAK